MTRDCLLSQSYFAVEAIVFLAADAVKKGDGLTGQIFAVAVVDKQGNADLLAWFDFRRVESGFLPGNADLPAGHGFRVVSIIFNDNGAFAGDVAIRKDSGIEAAVTPDLFGGNAYFRDHFGVDECQRIVELVHIGMGVDGQLEAVGHPGNGF